MPKYCGFDFYEMAFNEINCIHNNNNMISLKVNNNFIKTDNILIIGPQDVKHLLNIKVNNDQNQIKTQLNRIRDSLKRTDLNNNNNVNNNNVIIEEMDQNEEKILESNQNQLKSSEMKDQICFEEQKPNFKQSVVKFEDQENYDLFKSNSKQSIPSDRNMYSFNHSDNQFSNNGDGHDVRLSLFSDQNQVLFNHNNNKDNPFGIDLKNFDPKPVLASNKWFNKKIKSEPIERNDEMSYARPERTATPFPSVKLEDSSNSKYFSKNMSQQNEKYLQNSAISSQLFNNMKGSKFTFTTNNRLNSYQTQQNRSQLTESQPSLQTLSSVSKQNTKEIQSKSIGVKRDYSEIANSINLLKRPFTPNTPNTPNTHKKFRTGFSFEQQLSSFEAMRKSMKSSQIRPNSYCSTPVQSFKPLSSTMNVIPANTSNSQLIVNNNWLKQGFSKSVKPQTPSNGYIIGKSSQLKDITPQQTIQTMTQSSHSQFTQNTNNNNMVNTEPNFFRLFSTSSGFKN